MLETILAFLETQGPLIATTAVLGTTFIVKVVQSIGRVSSAVQDTIKNRSDEIDKNVVKTVSAEFQVIMEHIKALEEKAELDAMIQAINPVLSDDQRQAYEMFRHKASAMSSQAQTLITSAMDIFNRGKNIVQDTRQLTEDLQAQ